MTRRIALVVLVALALAACNRAAEPELTTTVPSETTTTAAGGTTTTSGADTTTTLAGQPVTEYEIVARSSSSDGETLYVVVPPGGYTDTDLEGFVRDLYEATPGLWELHVFDDASGADALLTEEAERTAEDEQALETHWLVSLVEASVIRFQGPFADSGEFLIGS
ncbi:MAG: hypothetical protein R6X29_02370 [Acidimicrobiia bacterium]|jgi:hypothetical protein